MREVDAYARLAGVYDDFVVDPCFARWADFLDGLFVTDSAGVSSVVDLCCGTGWMDSELIARGYRVVGLDASQAMLERARSRLGPDARLVHATLPDLPIDGIYDAATSTYDGFNYLTASDLRETLVRLARLVRAEGWLAFDLHAEAMLQLAAANSRVEGDWNGRPYRISYDVDTERRTCVSRVELTDDAGAFAEDHRQYIHDDATVRAALAAAGFDRVAVLDDYSLVPASATTLRATWIARRASTT